jgi:hypothetical protein
MAHEEPDLIQVNFNGDTSSLSDEQGQTSTTEIQTPNSSAQPLPKGKASLGSAVFNITNTIIGGGIVALPFVVKSVGIITAFVLFVVLAVMVAYSALILVKSSLFVFKGPKTYQDLAYKAFGKVGPLLVEIVADLYLLGAMTGYTIIVGTIVAPFSRLFSFDCLSCWNGSDMRARDRRRSYGVHLRTVQLVRRL